MTDPSGERDIGDAEEPVLDPGLADELTNLRPTPAAGFRGELGRYLASTDPGYGPRPARLRPLIAAYVLGGLLLVLGGLVIALATG